jgi:hypothetical protein
MTNKQLSATAFGQELGNNILKECTKRHLVSQIPEYEKTELKHDSYCKYDTVLNFNRFRISGLLRTA